MRIFVLILLCYSCPAAASNASATEPQTTATDFFSLLHKIKITLNQTLANLTQMNDQLDTHFIQSKDYSVENAKRLAYISTSYKNPSLCLCMLRTPCITQPVNQEPLDKTILHQYSELLNNNLHFYLYNFGNPSSHNIFNNTINFQSDDNKIISPNNLQKRIFISNKPTFIYLQKGHSVTILCPKLPPPFIHLT